MRDSWRTCNASDQRLQPGELRVCATPWSAPGTATGQHQTNSRRVVPLTLPVPRSFVPRLSLGERSSLSDSASSSRCPRLPESQLTASPTMTTLGRTSACYRDCTGCCCRDGDSRRSNTQPRASPRSARPAREDCVQRHMGPRDRERRHANEQQGESREMACPPHRKHAHARIHRRDYTTMGEGGGVASPLFRVEEAS